MALIREAALVANLCEAVSSLDYLVAGFLDSEMTDVFLRRHAEAGLEFSEE